MESILIIEDDIEMIELLRDYLKKMDKGRLCQ